MSLGDSIHRGGGGRVPRGPKPWEVLGMLREPARSLANSHSLSKACLIHLRLTAVVMDEPSSTARPSLSWREIARRKEAGQLVLVVDGRVYCITDDFLHPGGVDVSN